MSEQNGHRNDFHVAVAFDLMSLKIGDFWKAKHFTKPLQMLFSEWEGDDRAEKAVVVEKSGTVKQASAEA